MPDDPSPNDRIWPVAEDGLVRKDICKRQKLRQNDRGGIKRSRRKRRDGNRAGTTKLTEEDARGEHIEQDQRGVIARRYSWHRLQRRGRGRQGQERTKTENEADRGGNKPLRPARFVRAEVWRLA